jgi:hypothetical protein
MLPSLRDFAQIVFRSVQMPRRGSELCLPLSALPTLPFSTLMLSPGVQVHVFGADMRDQYDLESFYGASPELELPFLRERSGAPGAEVQWGNTM